VSGIQFRAADCDIVLDTIAVAEAQAERRMQLSRPYQRSGVGLVVRPDARGVEKFDDPPDGRWPCRDDRWRPCCSRSAARG
jgi:hypothetical protein